MEALELGADTIVTCGGIGPCRLGYYAEVQKDILRKLGFNFSFIVLEPAMVPFFYAMRKLFFGRSWFEIYRATGLMWAAFQTLDAMERKVCASRFRAADTGQIENIWQQALKNIVQVGSITEMQNLQQSFCQQLDKVEAKPSNWPLRIGLIGEIYALLEPFVNQHLVRRLGEMGVEVHKSMYLTDYIHVHLLKKRQPCREYQEALRLASPYLGQCVGGHGRDGVGNAVKMALDGFDGVIQVLPFTCMPEIIAKNILPKISKDYDMPVLSLTFDEQSGEAGMITRLEAFVDLLKYRRAKWEEHRV
jgi:predicted nucleotide-binding protein (sugar kinase/HSP70/actin superfamily)